MNPTPPRYEDWLEFAFNRKPPWGFDIDETLFPATSDEYVDLITTTLLRCGEDLRYFTEEEVNEGLQFIFNNSFSNIMFAFKDEAVSLDKRLLGIDSIKQLYTDCFEVRCAPVFGHQNQRGNALNHICYMLWDVTPLSYWKNDKDGDVFFDAILDVMQYALHHCKNIACLEGALHGLGHSQYQRPKQVEGIIHGFLKDTKLRPQNKTVRGYAISAMTGSIM